MNVKQKFVSQQPKSKRNSIVELMRFYLAMCVLIGHGFFPYQGAWSPICHTPVECFFILSGWFFISQFSKGASKYGQYGPFRSFWRLFKDKFKSLFFPVIVPCFICLQIGSFYDVCNGGMSMLWYVHDLALCFMIMYLIYYRYVYRLQNQAKFDLIIGIICIISTILRFITIPIWDISFPLERSISTITFAMLCTKIPQLKIKKVGLWTLTIIFFLINILAQIAPITSNQNALLHIRYAFAYLLFTPFLYFACQVSFNFIVFDYLGKISGPIYFYQAVNYLFLIINLLSGVSIFRNMWFLFWMPIVFAIIDDHIRRFIKLKNTKEIKNISFENYEKICLPFEKNEKLIWIIHAITIMCGTAFLAIGGVTSLSMFLSKAPNWQNWWWLTEDGEFSFFGKAMMVAMNGVFIPLTYSLIIQLMVNGRKKYPLASPTIKKIDSSLFL